MTLPVSYGEGWWVGWVDWVGLARSIDRQSTDSQAKAYRGWGAEEHLRPSEADRLVVAAALAMVVARGRVDLDCARARRRGSAACNGPQAGAPKDWRCETPPVVGCGVWRLA